MSDQIEIARLLRLYCGLTPKQADALLRLNDSKNIQGYYFDLFLRRGLLYCQKADLNHQAHKLTQDGSELLKRIMEIQQGSYSEAERFFAPDELEKLSISVTKLAREEMPTSLGLRASHLRTLIAVARQPGIVMQALLDMHPAVAVGILLQLHLVESGNGYAIRHRPFYVIKKGEMLLNWCLNRLDG